jgi:hypothetical protein
MATVDAGGTPTDSGSPALLSCPQAQGLSYTGCGFLRTSGDWTSTWKDGYACATCSAGGTAYSGCTMATSPGTRVEGPGPVLCVKNCASECCFHFTGAVCETDANCCAPLRCQVGDAGAKSCR